MKNFIEFDSSERMQAASEAASRELMSLPFDELVRLAKAESSSDLAIIYSAGLAAGAFDLGVSKQGISEALVVSGVVAPASRSEKLYKSWSFVKSFGGESIAIFGVNDDDFNTASYGKAAA